MKQPWFGVVLVVFALSLSLPAQDKSPGVRVGVLPPTPSLKTPVDYFRQLLAASGEEREHLLTNRPAVQRPQFRAIIHEFERCGPEERERRLVALELRFVITSILRLAPEARTQAVDRLAEGVRPMVRDRLEYWNNLEPDVQQVVLENERLLREFAKVSAGTISGTAATAGSNNLNRLELAVRDWNKLPEGKRMAAEEAFRKMFVVEVGGVEPAPGASPWSTAEREGMRRALDRFKQLSPAQRSQLVNVFPKLANLSPSERTAFLRSADEWQRMSVEDRQAWKGLVKRVGVLPPMPPGIRTLPPLPVRSMPFQTATNANGY